MTDDRDSAERIGKVALERFVELLERGNKDDPRFELAAAYERYLRAMMKRPEGRASEQLQEAQDALDSVRRVVQQAPELLEGAESAEDLMALVAEMDEATVRGLEEVWEDAPTDEPTGYGDMIVRMTAYQRAAKENKDS